ncbi:unnamed protein product, partial [Effrenium voratum]
WDWPLLRDHQGRREVRRRAAQLREGRELLHRPVEVHCSPHRDGFQLVQVLPEPLPAGGRSRRQLLALRHRPEPCESLPPAVRGQWRELRGRRGGLWAGPGRRRAGRPVHLRVHRQLLLPSGVPSEHLDAERPLPRQRGGVPHEPTQLPRLFARRGPGGVPGLPADHAQLRRRRRLRDRELPGVG